MYRLRGTSIRSLIARLHRFYPCAANQLIRMLHREEQSESSVSHAFRRAQPGIFPRQDAKVRNTIKYKTLEDIIVEMESGGARGKGAERESSGAFH